MNQLTEDHKVIFRDMDPGTTVWSAATSTNWLDMENYHDLMVVAFRTVGTGDAAIRIRTSAAADGSSPATVSTIGTTANTGLLNGASNGSIGNPGCGMLVVSCNADQVAAALADGKYVTAEIEATTATDEWGVAFIFSNPRYATSGLTVSGSSV